MAVSKRTRFEVLKRDNFTCQYCGLQAPDTELTVDHVIPVSLGGPDDPSNLVAACRDCNAGKSSAQMGDSKVAELGSLQMAYLATVRQALEGLTDSYELDVAYYNRFIQMWNALKPSFWRIEPPVDALVSLSKWRAMGVPMHLLERALAVSFANPRVERVDKWRYFAGTVLNMVKEALPDG